VLEFVREIQDIGSSFCKSLLCVVYFLIYSRLDDQWIQGIRERTPLSDKLQLFNVQTCPEMITVVFIQVPYVGSTRCVCV